MEIIPDDVTRMEVQEALPSGMERRLVLRLLTHWRTLCGDRAYPSFSQVDPQAISELWPHCFVLEVAGHEADPVFRLVGEAVAERAGTDLTGKRISEIRSPTLVGVTVSYIPHVIEKGVPVSQGGEFYKEDGAKVLYRSIVLPMSDDGNAVSGLLCAANCRDVDEP